jgi:AcrR family transcriptional regulator
MQIKKDEVKEKILATAKGDFLKYGFQKASLRDIAARTGVTKGNIYTYFKNKDQLFYEIVQPALKLIKDTMRNNHDLDYILMFLEESDHSAEIYQKDYVDFVYSLFDSEKELKLLFFASAGSCLENFREEIYDLYNKSMVDFCKRLSEIIGNKKIQPSEMLTHTFASMYLRLIEEILIHEPDKQELDEYIEQMATFMYHGVVNVIKLQL